jgi:hypothetical protein
VNITKDRILQYCKDYPDNVRDADKARLKALHVLMSNPSVKLEMVEVFLEKYHELTMETDINGDPLCAVAIRQKHSPENQLALFKLYPISNVKLKSNRPDDEQQLVDLRIKYLNKIFNARTNVSNLARQNGWVCFVRDLHDGDAAIDACINFIRGLSINTVEDLAYCKGNDGHSAMGIAKREIRDALEERIRDALEERILSA